MERNLKNLPQDGNQLVQVLDGMNAFVKADYLRLIKGVYEDNKSMYTQMEMLIFIDAQLEDAIEKEEYLMRIF